MEDIKVRKVNAIVNKPSGIQVTMEFITMEDTLEIAIQKVREVICLNTNYGEIVDIYEV